MGVCSCCREGCDNIMCDRRIRTLGYICGDCYDELLEAKKAWPPETTADDVAGMIEQFMDSPKGTTQQHVNEEVDAEFERLTRMDTFDRD